jgi:type I restriction enzyme, S subunit
MKTLRLGDCCDFYSGGTPSKGRAEYWVGTIPWFSPKDIKDFELIASQDHISEIAVSDSATRLVDAGTILVVGRSGVLAHTFPVGIVRQPSTFNQDIKAIVPGDGYDPEYVALYLKASQRLILKEGVKRGPTVHSLQSDFLEQLEIPDYPIPKQHQIAARLKAQLAEVEKACQAVEAQLHETAKLADAIVFESIKCDKPQKHQLGDVLEEVKKGIGASWSKYPVLGATRAGLAPAKEPPGKNPQRYKPAFPGTVFYNPMRILIGSIAFVDEDDPPGITSPDYVALQGRKGVLDSRWFYCWLRSPLGEQCISSLARGAVRERMLFNRLAEGEIDLPSYNVQLKAAKALAELKPMRRAIEKTLQDINVLPQKILAQAFSLST